MTPQDLMRELYRLEKPILQTNDWDRLRIRVPDLIAQVQPPASAATIVNLLRTLRLEGQLMFLPDWERWGIDEDENDGEMVASQRQHEPLAADMGRPTWRPREVFMPEDFTHWSVRSRVAETTRLLFANRQRFGLDAATAHLGYELQPRYRPDRSTLAVSAVVARLAQLADAGEFPRAANTSALKLALQIVGVGLEHTHIAAFQERAWEQILRSLFANPRQIDATIITAGVSSGKTFAFLLPLLTLLVYRTLCGEPHCNRALIIYPRTSLVEDQYRALRELLARVNQALALQAPGHALTDRPGLDAGQLLAQSLELEGSLSDALQEVGRRQIEIILTTAESLKNRMLNPRAVRTYLENVEVVILDEIHLMEGLAGCHGIYFIRRLRHLMRDLRQEPLFEPAWVGASATVAEPIEHCAQVLSLPTGRLVHASPAPEELVRFGTFHHLFVHTRAGKPSISAVTNGMACLTHTRNDGTAYNHYVDPAALVLEPRPSAEIPKTLAFVDSLSTIGRLRFTTADNEKIYHPYETAPPYYTWFFRPASRFGAIQKEIRSIGEQKLGEVRNWCEKCYRGQPARIDGTAFSAPEYRYLRTSGRMSDDAIARSQPPGFADHLKHLPQSVGNLDQCPFHEFRLCWWFSQDRGERRTIGNGDIALDQNRALPYTSKTIDAGTELHEDVNDYFLTSARALWAADGIPSQIEAVSTLIASPRIEVGVDFKNVRDGVTHKALRSASSFQQKIGRVGREDGSDSVILTFLAQRPTDAHFAHQPARLIDSDNLDPIPLKSENPDVLRNHLFAAVLEFIGSRPIGAIGSYGHELIIIGTGSPRVVESWEAKVAACIEFLESNRARVRSFLLEATKQKISQSHIAEEAIERVLDMLRAFVADLAGAYLGGQSAAFWFKENHPPVADSNFVKLLDDLKSILEKLRAVSIHCPPKLLPSIHQLQAQVAAEVPTSVGLKAAAQALQVAAMAALQSGLAPGPAGALLTTIADTDMAANRLAGLNLSAPLSRLRWAHEIIQAFFAKPNPSDRMREQYYLHDLLTKLLPFRDLYPFGLVRTHFQHVNARQVRVLLQDGEEDVEPLSTALYELLPGTWNYRWIKPRKSRCGYVNQGGSGEHFTDLALVEGPNAASFVPTGATLSVAELPADMPGVAPDVVVPILQPLRLDLRKSANRPWARFDNQLIGDDDESDWINDPDSRRQCPTLPRSFPATWYRVRHGSRQVLVVGQADPENTASPLNHSYPALGRALFEAVAFSSELQADRYVYAIDRTYGTGGIESPRIHYRHGGSPVVLGEQLAKTDGLTFRLKPPTLSALVQQAVGSATSLRGEVTIRALRRFIASRGACGPFQSEMIRKVVLMEHLDTGGTLRSFDAQAVRTALLGMTETRYTQIANSLINGIYAGVDAAEAARGRLRQQEWYDAAWPVFQTVQTNQTHFNDAFIASTAKDILVHTLAVTALDGLSRLVGAADGDLSYFHHAHRDEFYLFDSVEGGNGCTETIERYLQIPPLRRILASHTQSILPDADGFMLMEETLAACPGQCATRLLVETCQQGVSDPSHLRFPKGFVADLQARIRHEFDPITGARAIVDHLLNAEPAIFCDWHDLLWVQVLPERFAPALAAANVCLNLESLRSRTHVCVAGCIECVDNGDQSIYGALVSAEHVSRNLLDAVRQYIVASEPQAFLQIPAGTSVGAALQAQVSRPVIDGNGTPVTAIIAEPTGPRHVLLTQVLSTVSPDLNVVGGSLLRPGLGGNTWEVLLPFLAGYRDERPIA
jgi:Lhr-like helicase